MLSMLTSRHLPFICVCLLSACDGSADPDPTDAGSTPRDARPGSDAGDQSGDGNFSIGPTFADAPEYDIPDDAPPGQADNFDLPSSDCAHFTTDITTGEAFSRAVIVWIPAQHEAATAAPFIVLQDGYDYLEHLTSALTTLIHQGRVPPVIVIAIEAGPGGAEGERNLEYDTLSEEYLLFVEEDVLPRVRDRYEVELTSDPEGRAAMGGSSGGAAAFTMGWFRPDLYRRILTYSGTFVNQRPDETYPRSAWEYHEHLIADTDPKPLRVFLEAGENDFDWNTETDRYHSWLEANEAMADALEARGYRYRYVYAAGAEHVDTRAIRQTLPDALVWLWDGYQSP
jgi:enterochelin esterase family protein